MYLIKQTIDLLQFSLYLRVNIESQIYVYIYIYVIMM